MTDNTAKIRELNDLTRTAMGVVGRVYQTPGITALDPRLQSKIRERVETFDQFTPDNDPYGEHDCALLQVDGVRVIWKIDYYDVNYELHSDDPADPTITRRVLTIMLAEEY